MKTFKFYSVSKFPLYNTVLSTLVILFYNRSSDLIHLEVCTLLPKFLPWCVLFWLKNTDFTSILLFQYCVAAAAAKSLQSCPTLCDPVDGSPLGSLVPGILQARILEWVAISFSNAWKWKVKVKLLSSAELLATPWTAAYLAPPSMGFSRQEYWSGLPLPSPGNRAKITKWKQMWGRGMWK